MKHFSIRTALTGSMSLLLAMALFAQDALVDNNEDGTDQNDFEQYWYYYDDNAGVKEDDRPIAGTGTTPSTIEVPFTWKNRGAFGDQNDTFKVKEYKFRIDSAAGNKFASMPFTYGDEWEASYGAASPYVGIGTNLAADGKSIDLTGAESVSFKLRSRVEELSVVFKVETKDISDDSSFAYYQKAITVGKDWTTFIVSLNSDDLAQPGWTPNAAEREFALSQVTKLAWEVPGSSNEITGDTLDVDDILVTPFVFVSPTVWPNIPPESPLPEQTFSTFEGTNKAATPLNTYWFAYNDAEIGGNSSVNAGATKAEGSDRLTLSFEPGSGSDDVGYAPSVQFTLGKIIDKPNTSDPSKTDKVQGFIGIGFNVYDSATATFFDATTGTKGAKSLAGGVDGIYFEYLADGDFKYVTLEVSDIHDVGDATAGIQQYSRGSGIVHYRNFLRTGIGTWRAAKLRFSDLITNDSWNGYVDIPLDLTRLAKVQFKVQGAENDAGVLAIDNVYLTPAVSAIHRITRPDAKSGFSAGYRSGIVTVNWKNDNIADGRISIINTKGSVVTTVPVGKTTARSSRISAANLSAGLYFVQFRGADRNGDAVVRQTALSVVR